MQLKFGIIGCGKIADKRSNFLNKNEIIICYDKNKSIMKQFSNKYNCHVANNVDEILNNKNINSVIISTYHNSLSNLTYRANKKKLNILVEKPAGKNLKEIKYLLKNIERNNTKNIIQVGYNHRYHPAVIKVLNLLKNKRRTGNIMYLRARYGHGGRLKYNLEWRAKKELSGGGELIDQGSHLIDLSRLFLGEFERLKSEVVTKFWKMKVEDNAFIILSNKRNQIAHLHCSCTEWKNLFSFEIFCEKAKFEISGLGGSYGTEKLKTYYMKSRMGIPSYKEFVFNQKDDSWLKELQLFKKSIIKKKQFGPTLKDAFENMKIISKCYLQNGIN